MKPHYRCSWMRSGVTFLFIFGFVCASFFSSAAQIPIQPVQWETPILVPSPSESSSWFPDLAVDSRGNVHVVWCETFSTQEGEAESIFYSMWNGSQWTQYIDIAAPAADIRRNSLTIDANDVLHLSYLDSILSTPFRLAYRSVPAAEAYSAANWSDVKFLNEDMTYMNKILAYQDSLHLLYEDSGDDAGICSGCPDMYYRKSLDGGNSWQTPVSLYPTGIGTARPDLTVDEDGVLYASWDEGWDRFKEQGAPQYGVFMLSRDGGESWSDPRIVKEPAGANFQLTVEADGNGGIMLVWRTIAKNYPGIYYMWSNDYGKTWTEPQTLPRFIARGVINYFDSYDMAVDSAGHIHLLASGYQLSSGSEENGHVLGLYHFEWDGQYWYPPTQVYRGGLIPEYPHLVISGGNELHATWFLRHSAFNPTELHKVMYARGFSSAPVVERSPKPAKSHVQEQDVQINLIVSGPTSVPEKAPTPTWESAPVMTSSSLYTENDEYRIVLISLAPVAVIIILLILFVRARQRPASW